MDTTVNLETDFMAGLWLQFSVYEDLDTTVNLETLEVLEKYMGLIHFGFVPLNNYIYLSIYLYISHFHLYFSYKNNIIADMWQGVFSKSTLVVLKNSEHKSFREYIDLLLLLLTFVHFVVKLKLFVFMYDQLRQKTYPKFSACEKLIWLKIKSYDATTMQLKKLF